MISAPFFIGIMNQIDKNKDLFKTRQMSGRRVITSSVSKVTHENVLNVLKKAMDTHNLNRSEIDYLWRYYKGEQPIWHRTKDIRPEICNKIVENRANEIVSFKTGYLVGEPVTYSSKVSDERVVNAINTLNDYMNAEDKSSQDLEIVEWQMICGTSYRLVLPDDKDDLDEAPFEMYTLDPRNSFVVYSSEVGNKPLMGVKYLVDDDNITHYSVYTDNAYYSIVSDAITERGGNPLGCIPIFEYPANNARLGAFEIVLPLLDAINALESDRMDGVDQEIQSFIKFINCDIDEETFNAMKELGAIKVKSVDGQKADVDIVTTKLDQGGTQTLKEDYYNAILSICGMPNRNGGSSTSDTGAAVVLRDGWSLAEARAKDSEQVFKKSEKKMLKLCLSLCADLRELNLSLKDVEIRFTRRNYENIQSKSQVLVSMLQNEKIHPQLAFSHSGLFSDPESAYTMSMKYYDEQQKIQEQFQPNEPTNEPVDNTAEPQVEEE